MNEETKGPLVLWEDSHLWLSHLTRQTDDEDASDSVDEVIRYTLDELRFA